MPPRKLRPPPPPPPPEAVSLSLSSDSSALSLEPLVLLPPDGGYGWVVVAACFLMSLITDGAIYTIGFYQKSLQEDLAADSAAVALLASLCSGFYYVAGAQARAAQGPPLWSAVGNRWGFRAVSLLGSLVAAAAFAACFFITEYAVFVFIYGVVLGAASGAVYMATMISVGFYFERWRGVATSLTSCGSGVGILVMPLCYRALHCRAGYTWRWIMAFNAAAFGAVFALSLLLRPLQPIPVSAVRGERTVRFQDEESLPQQAKKGARPKGRQALLGPPTTLKQLHASQTSFSPSVAAPQFDAISMTSRAFPRRALGQACRAPSAERYPGSAGRSGPDARDMQSGSRPMYRDDIFYGASASRLTSQMSTRALVSLPVVDAVTSDTAETALAAAAAATLEAQRTNSEVGTSQGGRVRWCEGGHNFRHAQAQRGCCAALWTAAARCRLCPHAVTSTLAALLHHSILTNTVFLVFAATQVLFMLGYFTPFLFSQASLYPDQALKAGVEPDVAEWILPSLGVANAVGRALAGVACEVPGVSALVLSCVTMSIASLVVATTCVSAHPAYQLFSSSAYGFFMAPFMAMKSLILVDFLGIEKLTNSFGLLLMFQGFAIMIGPPMSGWIYDKTESYHNVYIISGSLLFIASVLPYLMYPLSTYELKKEMKLASRRSS
ncbi:Monocarboxylate transporter 14 [Frankliniella fusca]|uniref:Monocarboxylate transporter 14 n=1 Tax=Frankliniella fusca TaxID=407009 RepID=A0AAE1LPM8_9NEOP|nr:Monocarboxylate transporter 14 [Frankliniella fusca]